MGKIFNVLGACALIASCIAVSSCDKTYDEEELNRDIQKKLNEKKAEEEAAWIAKTTDEVVFAEDTFKLPARVEFKKTQPFLFYNICHTYSFKPEDKEVLMNSLYEQTANKSKYGNFNLDTNKYFEVRPLYFNDAVLESKKGDSSWTYYSEWVFTKISFSDDLGDPSFEIETTSFAMGDDEILAMILY